LEELGSVLSNFAHLSPRHEQLLRLLVDTTGITPPSSTGIDASKGRKRPLPSESGAVGVEPKRPRVKITLYQLYMEEYQRKAVLSPSREFAGRVKYGNQAKLYEELQLPEGGDKREDRGVRPPPKGGFRRGGGRGHHGKHHQQPTDGHSGGDGGGARAAGGGPIVIE
jgi:hypothetical protein